MGILPSCSCVSTTVWLNHLAIKEMFGDKSKLKLLKDAACSVEQILEGAHYKRAIGQPLTFHRANHLRKMSKT